MVGLPGSGKSTYADANFKHIVSPDRIRLAEFGTTFDRKIERQVWRRAFDRVRELLGREQVICFDATSITRRRRARLLTLAREADAPAIAIWMHVPEAVAWERNTERERTVPRRAFRDLARALEPPSTTEGFAAVLEVDGTA